MAVVEQDPIVEVAAATTDRLVPRRWTGWDAVRARFGHPPLGPIAVDLDDRPQPRLRDDRAMWILLAVSAVWVVIFSVLVVRRHDRFATFDFDLAIHDQAIWLMTHRGHGFLTVRGMPALGHHATFAYWLLAPLYWLGAGPNTIDVMQVVALAAPAVMLFVLARDRVHNSWIALVVGLAWLAHPSTQFLVWETFHPDVMGIPFLVGAYLAATKGRWRWFWVCLVLAMCWKEDYAAAVAMLGVVMVIWRQQRRGLVVFVTGMVWFVLTTNVLMPALTGHGTHAGTFYGSLGSTPSEIVENGARDPGLVMDRLRENDASGYLGRVGGPFGFVPLLSPVLLLVAVPQLGINLLSTAYFIIDTRYHYVAIPLAVAGMAAVEGLARLRDRRARVGATALIGVLALAFTVTAGLSPIGAKYDDGYWPSGERVAVKERAVAMIPPTASVASTYYFTPHLSHRLYAYTFPNPWRSLNWNVAGQDPDDPDTIEWVVVDLRRHRSTPADMVVIDELRSSPDWRVRFDEQDIVVLQRVRGLVPPTKHGTP